ncbi:MAG: S49 family peptidase [Gemmataceae bacterium]
MSTPADDFPTVRPVESYPRRTPPAPPAGGGSVWRVLFALLLIASLGLNILVCGGGMLAGLSGATDGPAHVIEKYSSGTASAANKVAIVKIEGAIMEGMLGYAHKQIEQAAGDDSVKAVVVRIESPGGTITASDELHRRLCQLRDGTTPKLQSTGVRPKPLVVSMGAIAASGGYYIAMPAVDSANVVRAEAPKIYAERTTITGSIGVYASLPNAAKFVNDHGFKMELIKAGGIKGSGSPFHEMTPQERQPWQDMVAHAYKQFIGIVEEGRPALKGKLETDLFPPKPVPLYDDKGNILLGEDKTPKTAMYTRKLADGGIFTADEAKQYGLVDMIGTVDDAAAEAAKQASLGSFKVVVYDKPATLMSALTGNVKAPDWSKAAAALGPRVWAIVPQAQLGVAVELLGQ